MSGQLAHKVFRATKVFRAYKVLQGLLDRKAFKASQAQQELLV
jgi:hypothetical protein